MIQYKAIYDISVTLGEEAIDYPDDTPYSRKLIWKIEEGSVCDLSGLELSTHAGTHIDAPAHFIANGKTIDQYNVGDFILPAQVVDINDRDVVKPEALLDVPFQPGEALLFRTENSTTGRCRNGVFSEHYVHLSPEAAKTCVDKGIALVGIDYISIEQYGNEAFKAHRTLLGAGVLVLEGINLEYVPPGKYTLFCLPLKMKSAEASPVRAVLIH